jgi:hypothetical protein
MRKQVVWILYGIVIVICALLASYKTQEGFETQLVINPFFIPESNTKQTCNVFSCDFNRPAPPPPQPTPEPRPVIAEPVWKPQPTCPQEISIEDLDKYNLYTPAENLVEERIAEKQQQLDDLEMKMQMSDSAFQKQQQAMEEAMRARQDAMRQTELADLQRKNTSDPAQSIMSDISKRLMRIEGKMNISPI